MKRFFSLFFFILLFSGCDDGNIDIVSFDFIADTILDCNEQEEPSDNFFLFNTQDKRVFIVQIPRDSLKNEVTPVAVPINIIIDGSANKVIYREYSSEVVESTICSTIPASSPIVVKEFNALPGGVITIVTTAEKTENIEDGSTTVVRYNHTITLNNITFDTDAGQQINESIEFGIYAVNATIPANYSAVPIKSCSNSLLYNYSVNQAFTITIDPTIFDATLGSKTRSIDGVTNILTYRVFDITEDLLTDDYFCTPTTLPPTLETWTADNSVDSNTGIIEVTTEPNLPTGLKHTIRFKNVTLTNGGLNFKLGTDYLFGTFITN